MAASSTVCVLMPPQASTNVLRGRISCLVSGYNVFNPFPQDKILGQVKLKAFADDKLNVTKMIISVFDRVENIVRKGEIACTSNFSFSHNVFKRLLSQTRRKVSLCGNGLALYYTILTLTLSQTTNFRLFQI